MGAGIFINADDFGRSRSTDDAILAAVASGGVNGISVFANSPIFDSEVERLLPLQGVDIGVHLDLSFAPPLARSTEIPSLNPSLSEAGSDRDENSNLTRKLAAAVPADVETEFTLQIERMLSRGIRLTHLDNHRPEIYFFPELFKVVVGLGKKYGLYVRTPFGRDHTKTLCQVAAATGLSEDKLQPIGAKYTELIASSGIRTADALESIEPNIAQLERVILNAQQGEQSIEVYCHPGDAHGDNVADARFWSSIEVVERLRASGCFRARG